MSLEGTDKHKADKRISFTHFGRLPQNVKLKNEKKKLLAVSEFGFVVVVVFKCEKS